MDPEFELGLFRFLTRLRATLAGARDVEQTLRSAVRQMRSFLEADAACLAVTSDEGDEPRILFRLGERDAFRLDRFARLLEGAWPERPHDRLFGVIQRRRRIWGTVGLGRMSGEFPKGHGKALAKICETLSEILHDVDLERMREVRSRIDRKIVEELAGKDLFYQILHGLRSLTRYDHSSALFLPSESGDALVLAAEQIAWVKAKSERIGERLTAASEVFELLEVGGVFGFERGDDGWREWTGEGATALAELFDELPESVPGAGTPPARSVLCAAIAGREEPLGLMRIASHRPGSLGAWEADLVLRFLPQVSVAIQNSRRTESLRANLVEAERRTAMADLARSVAHDVNNALGSVLPLLQQIRADLDDDRVDPRTLREDFRQIEESLHVCRRIFGGMLVFARQTTRTTGTGSVEPAIQSSLTILRDGMRRRGIELDLHVEPDLPAIRAAPSQLEQLFFNLLSNARDAMPKGGRLSVRAQREDDRVVVTVEDTGEGIPPENLPRIQEPFFTTKRQGNGLGLSIVRNILWEMRGDVSFDSQPGRGTRVCLRLPVARAPKRAATPARG